MARLLWRDFWILGTLHKWYADKESSFWSKHLDQSQMSCHRDCKDPLFLTLRISSLRICKTILWIYLGTLEHPPFLKRIQQACLINDNLHQWLSDHSVALANHKRWSSVTLRMPHSKELDFYGVRSGGIWLQWECIYSDGSWGAWQRDTMKGNFPTCRKIKWDLDKWDFRHCASLLVRLYGKIHKVSWKALGRYVNSSEPNHRV